MSLLNQVRVRRGGPSRRSKTLCPRLADARHPRPTAVARRGVRRRARLFGGVGVLFGAWAPHFDRIKASRAARRRLSSSVPAVLTINVPPLAGPSACPPQNPIQAQLPLGTWQNRGCQQLPSWPARPRPVRDEKGTCVPSIRHHNAADDTLTLESSFFSGLRQRSGSQLRPVTPTSASGA